LAPYVPTEADEITIRDLRDAHEYYLTERAQHPNAQNKFVFARSASKIAGFDAFHLVEDLLTQPLLGTPSRQRTSYLTNNVRYG
jgi:hypothetical protein